MIRQKKKKNIGVIGFGRFGEFWSKILGKDHQIIISDIADDLEGKAEGFGFKFANIPRLCEEVNAIFLCVPINQIAIVLKEIKPHIRPGTVVFDTCSVKVLPSNLFKQHLGHYLGIELVAMHPMFGPDSGIDGLSGLPLVMWPVKISERRYQEWYQYFADLGLNIVQISPEEHDRLAAYSQGVTHYIGRVLDEMNLQETSIDTRGYTILLSVIEQTCRDTWELFHDLQNYNPFTQDMRLRLENALDKVYGMILPDRVSVEEFVVGIQGGQGSFNEEACHYYCGIHKDTIQKYRIEYLYTTERVLDALHRGKIDRGVFAIQNARGGVVMETIRALSKYTCEIIEIFEIVISHCVLHHPDANFKEIDTIISHPQAFAQCAGNLRDKYSHLKLIQGEGDLIDQALCAQYIAEGKLPSNIAVLAPKVCAELYGLSVFDEGLQDLGDDNQTTFVWVQRMTDFHRSNGISESLLVSITK